MTRTISLGARNDIRFLLMGAGYHLCTLVELLVSKGFPKPLVVTYPRHEHERDLKLLTDPSIYKNVFETCERFQVPILAEKLTDTEIAERATEHDCTAVFSLSWRRRITRPILDVFRDRVFNLHPSILPEERGSGTFSYRIMNDQRFVAATIHLIDEDFDTGEVVVQERRSINIERPIPADYLRATNVLYTDLLTRFVDLAESESVIDVSPQNAGTGSYLPLLHTETNGAINWDWHTAQIDRFIRAFASPYPGAFTFLGDDVIALLDAEPVVASFEYHPFLSGRVIEREADDAVIAVAGEGLLRIRRVRFDGVEKAAGDVLRPGVRLHTPQSVLSDARLSVKRANQMNVPGKD